MNTIYTVDWFKRDSTYTRANKEMSIGWESTLNNQLCTFLYSNSQINTILSLAEELSIELKQIAITLGVKNTINVYVDVNSYDSMTDGNRILIAKKFNGKFQSIYDELDIEIGILCHEASHCLYTDFNYMSTQKRGQLTNWLHNVIEDELIETKLGVNHAGYVNFIAKMKYFYFDQFAGKIIDNECVNELDKVMKLFLYLIRYPKYITTVDENILNKYADLFGEIKLILSNNHCLNPEIKKETLTQRAFIAAQQIAELIKKTLELPDDEDKTEEDNENGEQSEQNENNSSNKSNSKKTLKEQLNECLSSDNSVITVTSKINKSYSSSSETNKTITYGQILNKLIDEALNTNKCEPSYGLVASDEIGDGDSTPGEINAYNRLVSKINSYIQTAKQLFVSNEYRDQLNIHHFRRNGSLDTNKLADAMMGINTIYNQRFMEKTKRDDSKYAFVIMLDESFSMSIQNTHKRASEIAVLMYEVCRLYPNIELYIYGHGDNVIPYITKFKRNRFVLANRIIQGNQNEVLSYRKIIEDVKLQTNLKIVAINITDSAYLADTDRIKDLIDEYKKKNVDFHLMCLGLNSDIHELEILVNDIIYGKNNWCMFTGETNKLSFAISELGKIIKKTFERQK